ncbi:MAG: RagB/SusD family nutrient uptake outer membrane protein, partial [Bacteroidales bacterium]|nr:RagB/SusD family nutrient uptake outer membrane protein [Bacteroidales bacterium]
MINILKNNIYRTIVCLFVFMLASCEDYLQPPTEAETTKSDAFTTYVDFQGFEDQLYGLLVDYINITMGSSPNTDDFNYSEDGYGVYDFAIGNYWYIYNSPQNLNNRRNHWTGKSNKGKGIWLAAWQGIRIANMALENMELLVEATPEERELLLGQAYFFRAFYHWEIIRSWGGVPYVTKVFGSSDDMNLTWENTGRRPHFQEVIEPLVSDLDSAAKYLPVDWSKTAVGADVTSDTESQMHGRATKGAAYGIKAKALLFAASPLMNKEHKGTTTYDLDLCKRSAEAANEVIALVDEQQVYELLPWTEYNRLFYTKKKESMF